MTTIIDKEHLEQSSFGTACKGRITDSLMACLPFFKKLIFNRGMGMHRFFNSLTVLLGGIILIGCVSTKPSTDAQAGLVITSPTQDYVFNNTQVNIYVGLPEKWREGILDAEISVQSSDIQRTLAKGDIRGFDGLVNLVAIWNTREFPIGQYKINVSAHLDGKTLTAQRTVTLRNAPEVSAQLKKSSIDNGRVLITFEAAATTDAPAEIATYNWSLGNGEIRDGNNLKRLSYEYPYPGTYTEYQVSVGVRDNLGGTNYQEYTLAIDPYSYPPVIFQAALSSCGCSSMLIDARANVRSTRYLGPLPPGAAGGTTAPQAKLDYSDPKRATAGQRLLSVNLGNIDPTAANGRQLGIGFEIEAYLRPGSNPAACTEGQYARGSITGINPNPNSAATPAAPAGGTQTLPLPPAPNGSPRSFTFNISNAVPYPQLPNQGVGPFLPDPLNFGGDDYSLRNNVKKYARGLNLIGWIDVPQAPVAAGTARNDSREFISFVAGTAGQPTCWCHFATNRTVTAGGVTGGTGLTKIQGMNCSLR